ncbi:high-affinity choline transporter 1-like isoform X1 [Haemaphysalis longicornis]
MLSYLSAFGCFFLAVPPAIAGAVAKSTNFTEAGYPGPFNLTEDDRGRVLPLVMHYLTPSYTSTLGLIAITAAIMSSVDSSMLSASSLVTRNIYHSIFRPDVRPRYQLPCYLRQSCVSVLELPLLRSTNASHASSLQATDLQISMVLRLMVVVIGSASTFMALSVKSVFALWTLSSDLVYVLLFPQFVALFYFADQSNAYGSFVGFMIGFILRGLCGEPLVHVPVIVRLPLYDDKRGQQFPFRTVCMAISLVTMLCVSAIAKNLFATGVLATSKDVWHCFGPHPEDEGPKKAEDRHVSDAKMSPEAAISHMTGTGATLRKPSVAQSIGAPPSQNRPSKDAASPTPSQLDKTTQKMSRRKSAKKASKDAQDASDTACNKK